MLIWRGSASKSGLNAERRWMVKELMRLTEDVPGDGGCGVYEGCRLLHLICEMNAASQKHRRHHHIFDSFEGGSAPEQIRRASWSKGDMARRGSRAPQPRRPRGLFTLYRGWIPNASATSRTRRFSFVHIDVDLYRADPRQACGSSAIEWASAGSSFATTTGFTTCRVRRWPCAMSSSTTSPKMVALTGGGGFLVKSVPTARHGQPSEPHDRASYSRHRPATWPSLVAEDRRATFVSLPIADEDARPAEYGLMLLIANTAGLVNLMFGFSLAQALPTLLCRHSIGSSADAQVSTTIHRGHRGRLAALYGTMAICAGAISFRLLQTTAHA